MNICILYITIDLIILSVYLSIYFMEVMLCNNHKNHNNRSMKYDDYKLKEYDEEKSEDKILLK